MSHMTREELIALVNKIRNVEGTEEEIDGWIDILEQNVPHPAVTDLIFYNDEELTSEEIVTQALAYKPINL